MLGATAEQALQVLSSIRAEHTKHTFKTRRQNKESGGQHVTLCLPLIRELCATESLRMRPTATTGWITSQ